MKKTKQLNFILLSFVCLFLSISLVSAVPPVTQVSQYASGLEIAYPQYQYVQQNTGFNLTIRVINETQELTNTTTDCDLHLDNPAGQHLLEEYMDYNTNEFDIYISSGNFSTLGTHSFVILCNTSTQVGFANGVFEVTETGKGHDGINFIFFIFIAAYLMMAVAIYTKDVPMTIIAGFALTLIGLYGLNNGITAYRNFVTEWLSILTIVFGGFWASKASLEGYLGGW